MPLRVRWPTVLALSRAISFWFSSVVVERQSDLASPAPYNPAASSAGVAAECRIAKPDRAGGVTGPALAAIEAERRVPLPDLPSKKTPACGRGFSTA
jgi:hypothetical protein